MCCCRKRQPRPLSEPEIDRSGSPRGSARRYASLEPRIHRPLGDRSTSCTFPIGVLAPLSRTPASPYALLPGRILKGRPACVHPPYWGFSDGNESLGAEAPRSWPTPSKTACQPMPPERPWPASARRSCGLSRAAPTRTLTPSRPSARKEAYSPSSRRTTTRFCSSPLRTNSTTLAPSFATFVGSANLWVASACRKPRRSGTTAVSSRHIGATGRTCPPLSTS